MGITEYPCLGTGRGYVEVTLRGKDGQSHAHTAPSSTAYSLGSQQCPAWHIAAAPLPLAQLTQPSSPCPGGWPSGSRHPKTAVQTPGSPSPLCGEGPAQGQRWVLGRDSWMEPSSTGHHLPPWVLPVPPERSGAGPGLGTNRGFIHKCHLFKPGLFAESASEHMAAPGPKAGPCALTGPE